MGQCMMQPLTAWLLQAACLPVHLHEAGRQVQAVREARQLVHHGRRGARRQRPRCAGTCGIQAGSVVLRLAATLDALPRHQVVTKKCMAYTAVRDCKHFLSGMQSAPVGHQLRLCTIACCFKRVHASHVAHVMHMMHVKHVKHMTGPCAYTSVIHRHAFCEDDVAKVGQELRAQHEHTVTPMQQGLLELNFTCAGASSGTHA